MKGKHVGGVVPDDTKEKVDGVHQRIAVKGDIPVGKDLGPNFSLAIKQPGMFTALLPGLARPFPCDAIVRNPWRSPPPPAASTRSAGARARPRR